MVRQAHHDRNRSTHPKSRNARKGTCVKPLTIALAAIIFTFVVGCGGATTPLATPPPDRAGEVTFTTDDGVELKGRLFGQGSRGVVLAHMYPADQSSWWGFAQTLADEGYVALSFDFRGYGNSGGDKEIKLIDRDVRAALDFLEKQGATTVFLAGASMGGTASLKVAAKEGEKLAGVVSLSAPLAGC